jgi:hypothetical protein
MGKNSTPAENVTSPSSGSVTTAALAAPIRLEHSSTQTKAAMTKS